MALGVNQPYQFSAVYQGAVFMINYQIDFGDGTKTGWFSGVLNAPTNVSHIFTKTGQYSVTLAARSLVGMQVNICSIYSYPSLTFSIDTSPLMTSIVNQFTRLHD
jgi:PKD repeat protein